MGRYTEAFDYQKKALEIAIKSFGEDYSNVAIFRNNLLSTINALIAEGNKEALMDPEILKILQPILEEKSSTPTSIEHATTD